MVKKILLYTLLFNTPIHGFRNILEKAYLTSKYWWKHHADHSSGFLKKNLILQSIEIKSNSFF